MPVTSVVDLDPPWFSSPGSGSVLGIQIRLQKFIFLWRHSPTTIRIFMDPHCFVFLDLDGNQSLKQLHSEFFLIFLGEQCVGHQEWQRGGLLEESIHWKYLGFVLLVYLWITFLFNLLFLMNMYRTYLPSPCKCREVKKNTLFVVVGIRSKPHLLFPHQITLQI